MTPGGQNTSHAVMAQRVEPHDSLDDFPTPPWATRALIERVLWPCGDGFNPRARMRAMTVWEPACNRGFMARPLAEYFARVVRSDVHDYSAEYAGQERVCDFLFPGSEPPMLAARPADWIVTNPPFRLAAEFALRAFALAPQGVALFVRTAFTEGAERYRTLFRPHPPSFVAQFVERVPLVKGRCDPNASTATAYCWIVWMDGEGGRETGTRYLWIPPCRKALERAGDYA
jgi:hypothetical protein